MNSSTSTRHLTFMLCACILTQPLVGCGGCDPDDDNSSDAQDMRVDAGADDLGTGDMKGDDGVEVDTPPDVDTPVDMTTGCTEDADCTGDNELCLQDMCTYALSCTKAAQGPVCVGRYKRLGLTDVEADRGFCDALAGECRLACVRDVECAEGEVCTDDGLCMPFEGEITGEDPGGEARAPLKAGVGNTLMHFPIGLSLGGYGTRAGSGGRYSEALVPSHGQMHGLYARAIMLDNGERQLMLVRMPIIFPTGPMHEMVARRLQEKTGKDWRNSLVISGTHTHSGPGRFLHLPPPDNALLPLGAFGTDNFNDQAFEWIVDSAVEAAEVAMDDLSDARLGWEIVESFDVDDDIASDRWGATPPFDDNRLLLMRVDDPEGNPRALLMSFGMHGTYFDSSYASGDAAGGIERAVEARLGEEYDRFVPTLFFNQNGGSMSPRGDRHGHQENHKFEHIGYRFANMMWEEIRDVQTDTDVELAASTMRFPLGYEALGYTPGEWSGGLFGPEADLKYGGLQCDVSGFEDNDYTTYQEPNTTTCVGIDFTMYNRPPTLFLRSQMTALNIDGLTIVTLPGEAAMELGWQVVREISKAHDLSPLDSWTWGYAQDHQFYLTPSNLRGELPPFPGISTPMAPDDYPDYAFSYYQGGYEAGFTIWGARMGDYLVDRAVDVTGRLFGKPEDLAFDEPLPLQYSKRGMDPFPIDPTPEAVVGTIAQDVPATATRQQAIEFAWVGGDPGAEMPQAPHAVLEKKNEAGEFEPVLHKNRRTYDNREHLMLTRLRLDAADVRREWVVYWEELKDFPLGTYRFKVDGHYQTEAGERAAYSLESGEFEVVASTALVIDDFAQMGDVISGRLSYPAADAITVRTGDPKDRARVEGSYRMRHPEVPSGSATPITAGTDFEFNQLELELVASNGDMFIVSGVDSVTQGPENVDGRDGVPVTRFTHDLSALDPGSYTLNVTITDNYGNSGTFTTDVTITP